METRVGIIHTAGVRLLKLLLILGVGGLFIVSSGHTASSETAIATTNNCVNYVSDIEKKHESVSGIKENGEDIQRRLMKKFKTPEGDKSGQLLRLTKLEISGKELIELMPPTTKIYMEARPMSGTLPPETCLHVIKDGTGKNADGEKK
ncbi:MAG: hypothetical protein WC779_04275 [Candidatus Omnitrophota bacterium]|jgi:hypothetical protein